MSEQLPKKHDFTSELKQAGITVNNTAIFKERKEDYKVLKDMVNKDIYHKTMQDGSIKRCGPYGVFINIRDNFNAVVAEMQTAVYPYLEALEHDRGGRLVRLLEQRKAEFEKLILNRHSRTLIKRYRTVKDLVDHGEDDIAKMVKESCWANVKFCHDFYIMYVAKWFMAASGIAWAGVVPETVIALQSNAPRYEQGGVGPILEG